MIHFLIGGAGCGKSYRLMERLRQHAAEGGDVLAIVPEQFSYEFDRKLYDFMGTAAFNAIETHSFTSLARSIFQRFGGGEPGTYMDDLLQSGLMEQAIRQAAPELRFYGKQCNRPDFMASAGALLSVLRRSGMAAEQMQQKCNTLKGRLFDRTFDLSIIYRQYEMLLAKHHLKDMLTDITEAAAIANGNDYFAGKIVCIDEFESFTPDQYEMLSVICPLADEVYIALRMESEQESELSLFASVGAACRKIREIAKSHHIPIEFIACTEQKRMQHTDLQRLSENIFRPSKAEVVMSSEHIHIFEAKTPADEAEFVCATIKRLLAEDDTLRCSEIAVVTNQLPEYADILEHAMERYALPYHLDLAKPILHTPFMVYLTSLFGLLTKRHPDTELLLRCGKSGYTDCDWMELSRLENYCYIWSIDGEMWNAPFTQEEEGMAIEPLREQLLRPLVHLRECCAGARTGADYSRAVYAFLEAEEIGVRAERLMQHPDETHLAQMMQDFKRVWESLMDILDVTAFLYEDVAMTKSEYFSVVQRLMQTIAHAVPPRTLDAIFIGPAGTSRLSEPKVTFVLGTCEGIFPKNAGSSVLFSERDRILLAQCGIDIGQSPELNAADERLAVYKILSSASQALYLCYPLSDFSGRKCSRSSIIVSTLSFFSNEHEMLRTQKTLSTAYYAVTKSAAYYHYVQDFSKRDEEISAIQTLLYEDAYYARRIDYLRQVHEDTDFTLEPSLMERLVGSRLTLTATRLETFRLCPFHFFCQYALKLFHRRKKELGVPESGSLIHACLEMLLRDVPREIFLSLTPTAIAERVRDLSGRYWEMELGGDAGKSIRDTASLSYITDGMVQLALHLQKELRQSDFYPAYLELEISDSNPLFPSPRLITPSGHDVRLFGKIDRVDVCRDGETEWVRVVDYKSGSKKFAPGNLLYGLDMQMLLYLFSVIESGTEFEHAKPAGVLYLPAGAPTCTAERGLAADYETELAKQYCMNGLLLDDVQMLRHMDKELSGKYIAAKLRADGVTLGKQVGHFVNETQMKQLRTYVKSKVIETAESIYSGDVAVDPMNIGNYEACKRCAYADLCGISGKKCRKINEKPEELKKQFFEKLKEMEETGDGMDKTAAERN